MEQVALAPGIPVEEEVERVSAGGIAAWLVLVMSGAGLGLSVYLFGLPIYVPVQFALVAAALILRADNAAAAVVAAFGSLGLDFASVLFGFPVWPTALVGLAAILLIASHAFSKIGVDTASGDPNPVYYAAAIVGTRAWLALLYSEVSTVTTTDPDIVDWITLFVFGAVPDLPIIANVLLVIILNGTLLFAVPWWIKRLVFPS